MFLTVEPETNKDLLVKLENQINVQTTRTYCIIGPTFVRYMVLGNAVSGIHIFRLF